MFVITENIVKHPVHRPTYLSEWRSGFCVESLITITWESFWKVALSVKWLGCGLHQPGFDRFPAGKKIFLFFKFTDRTWDPPRLLFNGQRRVCPRSKATLPTRLHTRGRENLIYTGEMCLQTVRLLAVSHSQGCATNLTLWYLRHKL